MLPPIDSFFMWLGSIGSTQQSCNFYLTRMSTYVSSKVYFKVPASSRLVDSNIPTSIYWMFDTLHAILYHKVHNNNIGCIV